MSEPAPEPPSTSAYGTDEIWTVFDDAVLTITVAGRPLVVGRDALPWAALSYAITGWNPGRECSSADNDAANRRLRAELTEFGVEYHAAVGSSPDGSWSEPGYAVVGITRDDAVALGRRYGQLAIYEIIEGHLLVVPCDT